MVWTPYLTRLTLQAHIGEHILRSRASAVVVETALTPQHGARSGNEFQCEGEDIMHAGPFARMLCYCARQLAELPNPADAPIWEVRYPSAFDTRSLAQAMSGIEDRNPWTVQRLVSVMFPCYTH